MRRLLAGAMGGLLAVLLAGCTGTEGVDGDLTDDWRPLTEARQFAPQAGVCLPTQHTTVGYLSSYHPVDCAEIHYTETVHVGRFTGAYAEATAPPSAGSPAIRDAYAECDKRAKAYLGDDWRTARLWLGLTLPHRHAWAAGSRWYRCELQELASVEEGVEVRSRQGSLKGALAGPSPLRLGCYLVRTARGRTVEMRPVACDVPHQAEFVGVFAAPDVPYPKDEQRHSFFENGCLGVLARFAGVPDDSEIKFRSGVIWIPARQSDWRDGDRGIRCYLWMNDRNLRRSMRGAGTAGLPAG